MGDQIGVHSGHGEKTARAALPERVVSMADDFAKTWRDLAASRNLDSAADVMSDLDEGNSDKFSDIAEGQSFEEEGHASDATSRWSTLRHSTAWKDREFLMTLRTEVPPEASSGQF
jgi:hypothetical protein